MTGDAHRKEVCWDALVPPRRPLPAHPLAYLAEWVKTMSEKLPPGVREYITQQIEAGQNNHQIAEAAGVSWNTVAAIREEIEERYQDEESREEKTGSENIPDDAWKTCYTAFEDGQDIVAVVTETGLPADVVRHIHEYYCRDKGIPSPETLQDQFAELKTKYGQLKEKTEKELKGMQTELENTREFADKIADYCEAVLHQVQEQIRRGQSFRIRHMVDSLSDLKSSYRNRRY